MRAKRQKTVDQLSGVAGLSGRSHHLPQFVNQPIFGKDFSARTLRQRQEISEETMLAQALPKRDPTFEFNERYRWFFLKPIPELRRQIRFCAFRTVDRR